MITPMTFQLGELKDLLEKVRQKSERARDGSEDAGREADRGREVRGSMSRSAGSGSGPRPHSLLFRTCGRW